MAKRVTAFENAFWRGPLLKNELRTEPEHFRIPFETAFSCGPLGKIIFESDSKTNFCVHLLTKQPWAWARDFLFAWTSRQLDVRIKTDNDFWHGLSEKRTVDSGSRALFSLGPLVKLNFESER